MDTRVDDDVGGRQRDHQRRPDGLQQTGPRTAPASVGVEVELEPIAACVVDCTAGQSKLTAQHLGLDGQVERRDRGKHRVVGPEQFDEVDGGRSDVESPADGVGDCQTSGKDDIRRRVSRQLHLQRGSYSRQTGTHSTVRQSTK